MAVKHLRPGFIPVLKAYKGLIAAAFTLMVFSGFGQSVFFGAFLPEIQARFDIDKTTLGSIYAAATITSALLLAWSGKFLDTMPLTKFVTIILTGLAIGCALMGLATHPAILFLAFLCLRQFGQGLMVLAGTTAINRYIEDGRGRAQSIAQTGLPIHSAIFPITGLFILNMIGFTASWLLYSGFIIIILLPFYFFLLRSHEENTHKAWQSKMDDDEKSSLLDMLPDQWTRKRVLMDWRFYAIMSIMVVPPCFGTAVFFFQSIVAEANGISQTAFAGGFVFLTLASVISALAAGVIMDNYGEKPLLLSFPLVYAGGLLCLASGFGVISAYAGLAIIGVGGGIMSITGGPLYAKMYGTKHYGSIKSLSIISMVFASAISPPLTGYLLDTNIGIDQVLIYFSIYALLAWVFIAASIGKITKSEEKHENA